jgi:hypothetical protein
MPPIETLAPAFSAVIRAQSGLSLDVANYREVDDATLLELTRLSANQQRLANSLSAVLAGEVARRSAPVLGKNGLAQRAGHRTPEELFRATTGSTARDAATAVKIGQIAADTADAAAGIPVLDPATGELVESLLPWLHCVGRAVTEGALPVAAAEAIRNGLGRPSENVSQQRLAEAAALLCNEAGVVDADRLFRRARELRDDLDEAGIADREAARREQRSLRFRRLPNGMSRLVWDLDPETSAAVGELYDRATSPRRGGPRFVSGESEAQEQRILADTRSTEQLASDVFAQLLRQGADADSSQLLGSGAPVVRVLVTAKALGERTGHRRLEAQSDAVSIETIERAVCAGATTMIRLEGDGQPLDVGREQRLFTRAQRIALAVRDGGCMATGCDRPPSWCECHHIEHWERDGGTTNVVDGILLCRHHHLLFHNAHWEIVRRGARYWLIPPPDVDPRQVPIEMRSRSAAMRDWCAEDEAERGAVAQE